MELSEDRKTSLEVSSSSTQQPSTSSKQEPSISNQTIDMSSIAWADDDDQNNTKKPRPMLGNRSICCGAIIGALVTSIALATILTIWLLSKSSKNPTTKLTTFANTTTSTITTVTSTTSTSTTTADPCLILRWNTTGQIVAGTGGFGSSPSQLDTPHGIWIDSNDVLYVCDSGNNRIQRWTIGAFTGSTVAGRSNGAAGSTANALKDPIDLAFDKNGYLYVVDEGNNRVQSFALGSTIGVTVAGNGNAGNSLNQLSNPSGIAIDESLNLYITDTGNQRIMKWSANATNGTVFTATAALIQPYGIVVKNGSTNKVYVSDLGQNRVQLWSAGANQANQTLAGISLGDLNGPTAIKFDSYGNLYVANSLQGEIRRFCTSSTVPEVIIGNLGTIPSLNTPAGIAFDSNYNLYVADSANNYVLKFSRL